MQKASEKSKKYYWDFVHQKIEKHPMHFHASRKQQPNLTINLKQLLT